MVTPELKCPTHELDAVTDEFIGDGDALLGIGKRRRRSRA